ncbi:4Fe-4S binding protein [Candidatus Micrarchaeota archaeon]|nr:4Fe-4S binding protein [Candidatus Micrarchaeota archaeon]
MSKRVILQFPMNLSKDPLLSETILKTGATFNIIKTEINSTKAEILGDVIASDEKIEEFIRILKRRGVIIKMIDSVLLFSRNACVDCGLCVSLCPTQALLLNKDFTLKLELDNCILCQKCVVNCPVRAFKYQA